MKNRAVVVGAGVAGATAGLILARAGWDVTLVEQARDVLPLVRGFRRSGLLCDTGFHYTGGLEDGGFLTFLFGHLGVIDRLTPAPMAPDGFDVLVGRERTVFVPTGLAEAERAFVDAFPVSRRAIADYFQVVARLLVETPFLNPAAHWWDMRRGPEDDLSLAAFLEDRGAEGELVDLLGLYGALLYGMDARETPLRVNAIVLGSYFRSAQLVLDGGEAIADAFAAALAAAGVRVSLGRRVAAIATEGGAVNGVRTDEAELLPADAVVFAAHPQLLPAVLPQGAVRPAYRSRIEGLANTPAVFIAYLLCPSQTATARRNFFFVDDPAAPLALMAPNPTADGTSALRVAIEPASAADARWSLAAGPGGRPDDYVRRKALRGEAIRQRARRFAPDLGPDVEILDCATPATFRDWVGAVDGAAYGLKRSVSGLPLVARTPVAGLFLAGQSLLTPGIMGAAASGIVAAGHILGPETAWKAVVAP